MMYLFAWIANILTVVYKIPQMYTFYRQKNTKGVSLYSFCIQTVSYVLYIIHGVYINDDALSYGMIPALTQNLILVSMYLYYGDKVEKSNKITQTSNYINYNES